MRRMIVQVRDVSMRLAGGGRPVTILDRVSLDALECDVLAITGPSGSGKSTLLGLIAGLDRPTSGSIVVDGIDITRLDENGLARLRCGTIGFVVQSFQLIPPLPSVGTAAVPPQNPGHHAAPRP